MESNERISPKQFLSKIEEGQAKLYYDFGKRVHSYFEDTFKEMQKYLQQFSPQYEGAITEDFESNEQSPHNYELLQQEIQKLKRTNENQKSQIQKLKEENAQLLRKATKPSSRKMKDKNDSDDLSSHDETVPKMRKTRTPKNMKAPKTFTGEDGTNENESEPVDHKSIDRFEEEVDDKEKKENLE
ncbi:hypothetical protein [Paenibacillus odorifer]|uniref:hypothetical protein n=1 Tax=Paenibacillus odorifer TaxID=189426 RepID=UPI000BA0B340|nr:hypothetical protein [Paenibacillus odorifer]OZQ73885.1 hypothetical protein CA596_18425 [Paenibacillus odorifer]